MSQLYTESALGLNGPFTAFALQANLMRTRWNLLPLSQVGLQEIRRATVLLRDVQWAKLVER